MIMSHYFHDLTHFRRLGLIVQLKISKSYSEIICALVSDNLFVYILQSSNLVYFYKDWTIMKMASLI